MPVAVECSGRTPITTFESAREEDINILNRVSQTIATQCLVDNLWEHRDSITALTKHHLGLTSKDACAVLHPQQWIQGSFNVCVPVEVKAGKSTKKFIFRCPMPHKLAESKYPGSVDEKVSCEVGTYIWMQENCCEVRIPDLIGFGFSDGRHFTHSKHRSFLIHAAQTVWRHVFAFLQRFPLSYYTPHPISSSIGSAYLLMEYIGPETGQMLSETWESGRADAERRRRLFRSMSQVMLSLARIPQPQIGSFQFNDDSTIALTNRPLFCSLAILENDGTTRALQRKNTYKCTEAFVSDIITFHDNRFLDQANAVQDAGECRGRMAVMSLLRALSHRYILREYRNGPFLLQLTDLHASNIFVDHAWNITCLLDLEWICALPSEMLKVPYWLTNCGIDEIQEEQYDEFDIVRTEFMQIFEEEEYKMEMKHQVPLSKIMKNMWDSKGVWFWHCLSSVNAMYILFDTHLCPTKYLPLDAERIISEYWCKNSEDIVQKKLADRRAYDEQLKAFFEV